MRAAPLLAIAAAAGLVLAVSGCGSSAPKSTSSTRKNARASSPAAAVMGNYVVDLTWVSDNVGWALAAAPCGQGLCTRVARTENGGRSWTVLPNPPAYLSGSSSATGCSRQPCVEHLRFATATIGYLYGPSLLITHNGGLTWERAPSPPVESLQPGPGDVLRVVYDHDGCPGPCRRIVEAAAAGSEDWRVLLASMPANSDAVSAEVIRSGKEVIYVPIYGNLAAGAGSQQTTIYRSLDAGRSWVRLADPCDGSGTGARDAISLSAAPGGFLAALCRTRAAPDFAVMTSTDDGRTWGPSHQVPSSQQFSPDLIAAASLRDLIITNSLVGGSGPYTYRLMLSTDGGAHWSTVVSDREQLDPDAPSAPYLGFQDSLLGRWVGYPRAVWTTTDGGRRWTRRPFP